MGDIRLSLREVGVTGYLRVFAREVANPGAVVAEVTIDPPIPDPYGLVFTGLNEIPHYVDFYESTDGISTGLLLMTILYDVGSGVATSEMRFYKADGVGTYDPASGTSSITDPYLAGKNVVKVFKEGFRFLKESDEFTQAGDTVTIPVSDALPDPTFGVSEVISLEIAYVSTSSSTASSQNFPKDVIAVPSNITLSSTHYSNMMEATSGAGILTITFPAFSGIPDGTKFGFNTDNGTQTYMAIVLPGGSYCMVGGVQRGTVYLGRGEELTVIKKANYLRIINWSGDHRRVGDRVSKDGTPPLNSLPETGGWYLKSQYPRLWEWYINMLPPSDIVNAADDSVVNPVNAPRWNVGTTKFWVPDRRGYMDKASEGARRAGEVQTPQVGQFELTVVKANGFTGNPGAGDVNKFGYGAANPVSRTTIQNNGVENRVLNAAVFTYRII
jgi:hypothetical protein